MNVSRKSPVLDLLVWISMLGGPVVWAIVFQWAYARVLPACAGGSRAVLFVIVLVGLGLTIGLGVLGWRLLAQVAGDRTREFMIYVGLGLSSLSSLLIITHAIAVGLISPCWFPP